MPELHKPRRATTQRPDDAWRSSSPRHTAAVIALVIFFGLGYGLPDLLRGTLVVDYYGLRHYPRINGVLATFVVGARAGGPLLAGVAVATLHSQTPTLAGAAALTAISAYALHRAHDAHRAATVRG